MSIHFYYVESCDGMNRSMLGVNNSYRFPLFNRFSNGLETF